MTQKPISILTLPKSSFQTTKEILFKGKIKIQRHTRQQQMEIAEKKIFIFFCGPGTWLKGVFWRPSLSAGQGMQIPLPGRGNKLVFCKAIQIALVFYPSSTLYATIIHFPNNYTKIQFGIIIIFKTQTG